MDEILITGLTFQGYHGCLPEERKAPHPFIIDLALRLDLSAAAAADDLTNTVDYDKVCLITAAVVEGIPRNLIETVASSVCDALLREFAPLASVAVTLHKPQAPVRRNFSDIAVHMERVRHE